MPISALKTLAKDSPVIDTPAHRRIFDSVEGFPATKLYLWFDRPWWRDGSSGVVGIRTTTDLPNRKVFYVDTGLEGPAAILAAYTDGLDNAPLVALADGGSAGAPAPPALLATVIEFLRAMHPTAEVPWPLGSAFMHWGADPREIGWTYWLSGIDSDDVMARAINPIRSCRSISRASPSLAASPGSKVHLRPRKPSASACLLARSVAFAMSTAATTDRTTSPFGLWGRGHAVRTAQ